MSARYVCVHGHFYQPPRENPWLEAVERQESAQPDHDWNERITRECYGPNARARVLDPEGWIVRVASNYARMSFNFGPTLLSWLELRAPRVYRDILDADKASAARFSGHGSAIAQAYNHAILPLCNDRDRRTQVRWGIRDFERRFGRKPEGMWLPETAADTPSLEALAHEEIAFAILAPRQAARTRRAGSTDWQDVSGAVDPSRAYRVPLPSGRSIAVFFYDGPISRGVAFEGLLNSGDAFATRLLEGFSDGREHAQLVHIATDGESYGHHHRHGEMALAAALEKLEGVEGLRLTNYGEFLGRHPPEFEAQIHENTSWSCEHGIERWRSACGCCGGRPGCHQRWRAPLREALDSLRDAVAPLFEAAASGLLKDPWGARDDYVNVVLERTPENVQAFLSRHASRDLSQAERGSALQLLELQRHAMLMYTSCGWFFDDIAGIETVQILQYAGRVVQLAQRALGADLERAFVDKLATAAGSGDPSRPDGRAVYEQIIKPSMVDLSRVAAHHAIASLFEPTEGKGAVYAFEIEPDAELRRSAGRARLLVGCARVRSTVTLEEASLSYGALHLGDHMVSCGVRPCPGGDASEALMRAIDPAFERADLPEVLRVLDREFGHTRYSIASLFRDEQHKVVRRILRPTLDDIDASYRQIYEQHAPLARFLRSLDLPVPRRIQMVGSSVISQSIRRLLEAPKPDLQRVRELLDEGRRQGAAADAPTVSQALLAALHVVLERLEAEPRNGEALDEAARLAELAKAPPFDADLSSAQNLFVERLLPLRPEITRRAADGDEQARAWNGRLDRLSNVLRVRVPA